MLCHRLLGEREGGTLHLTCAVCRHRFRPERPPWCERCGQPEPHFGPCRLCVDWPVALRTVRSAVWLAEGAQQAVHALKYGGLPRIADDLALVMEPLGPRTDGTAALIPIPLAPQRLRARGYNQSERLARARETPTQTALTPGTRLANVAGAFEARNAERGTRNSSTFRLPSSALILVDDVFTTGATLAEAARALAQAGATTIHGVTFARAAIPDFS